MKKDVCNTREIVSQFLSAPFGDILSSIEAHAYFFIHIAHDAAEIQFIGLNEAEANPEAAERLRDLLDAEKETLFDAGKPIDHQRLFELIPRLARGAELTGAQTYGAAVHLLESQGLSLGDITITNGGDSKKVDHWALMGDGRPLIRFQDSLDWAATYGFNLKRMQAERADTKDYYASPNSTVLKVPLAVERLNLVTPENVHIFLAEHILSLGTDSILSQTQSPALDRQSLSFHFLPMKGFGQWRAAVNWIERENVGRGKDNGGSLTSTLESQTSSLTRLVMEEMFTILLLNSFGMIVRDALDLTSINKESHLEKLFEAFSLLWWSDSINFFKDGRCVRRLLRDPQGKLVKLPGAEIVDFTPLDAEWISTSKHPYEGFFSYSGDCHPNPAHIRLKLDAIVSQRQDDEKALLERWPFDEVQYSCYFFKCEDKEVRRWSHQMAQRLGKIIEEQALRLKAMSHKMAEVYESSTHWLNGSITSTGWIDSLQAVRKSYPELAKAPDIIQKVERTLSLMSIPAGSTGLLRLVGILHKEEYQKLDSWFDEEALDAWGTDEAVEDYVASLTHLARAIGSAFGRPWVHLTKPDGTIETFSEYVQFDMNMLHFPPLSRANTDEPVFALLPAFIEPLMNALRYLDKERQRQTQRNRQQEPIRIIIEDKRQPPQPDAPPHIFVRMGNYYQKQRGIDPSGVKRTRLLFETTRLATLKECSHEDDYWWTPILLHPHELYYKIVEARKNR